MDPEHFRMLIWQKAYSLLVIPMVAFLWQATPFGQSWSEREWSFAAAIAAAGATFYLAMAWQKSRVTLDEDGITLYVAGQLETVPYEKLLKVKRVGRYRIRLCVDSDIPDVHQHVSFDLANAARFATSLRDWYEDTQGHSLDTPEAPHDGERLVA